MLERLRSVLRDRRQEELARTMSREALDGLRLVQSFAPQLSGEPLYEQVLAARFGVDPRAAQQLIEGARTSFAQWPVQRDLTFCDVVHYYITCHCLQRQGADEEHWLRSRIGQVVRSVIPRTL